MFKEKIIIEMKEVFKEIPFGIEHTLKVLKNAEDIMKGENIGEEEKEFISINVFARVEPELKEQAESVLDQLGIPMSNAVGMFLRQIVLQKVIPFEMKLPRTAPLTYGSLTKEQFDKEIEKGMSDVKAGRVYSADAIEAEMN